MKKLFCVTLTLIHLLISAPAYSLNPAESLQIIDDAFNTDDSDAFCDYFLRHSFFKSFLIINPTLELELFAKAVHVGYSYTQIKLSTFLLLGALEVHVLPGGLSQYHLDKARMELQTYDRLSCILHRLIHFLYPRLSQADEALGNFDKNLEFVTEGLRKKIFALQSFQRVTIEPLPEQVRQQIDALEPSSRIINIRTIRRITQPASPTARIQGRPIP